MELFSPSMMSERESWYTPLYENGKNERVKLQMETTGGGEKGWRRTVGLTPVSCAAYSSHKKWFWMTRLFLCYLDVFAWFSQLMAKKFWGKFFEMFSICKNNLQKKKFQRKIKCNTEYPETIYKFVCLCDSLTRTSTCASSNSRLSHIYYGWNLARLRYLIDKTRNRTPICRYLA